MEPPFKVGDSVIFKDGTDGSPYTLRATATDLAAAAETVQQPETVNLPNHYARFKFEPIRFLVENYGAPIIIANIVKYIMRYDAKNGLEDIRKAKRYLHMLERYEMKDPDWWKADRDGATNG